MFPGDEIYESPARVEQMYRKAVAKGMLKVMAKMGISTLRSYKGAQIFEAVGLASDVIDQCFVGTASRIEGVSLDVLAEEALRRFELGYPGRDQVRLNVLSNSGEFHWRADGERHMWDPESIFSLQQAAQTNDKDAYWRFAEHVNEETTRACELRGLMDFKGTESVPFGGG